MSAEAAPPVHYEVVAASATAQVLGSAAADDRGQELLQRVIIIPTSTSPGSVAILDNTVSTTIFDGGASSLTELKPIVVELGINSVNGPWKVTTGANVRAFCVGRFK